MRRVTIALLSVTTPPLFAQAAPNLAREDPPAAKVSVADAIASGVRFLVGFQNKDGSFGSYTSGRDYEVLASVPGSLHAFKAASTALCWMGLTSVPHRTDASEKAAAKALGWLVENVRVRRPNGLEMYNIWAFGYGLQALSRALRTKAKGADPAEIRRVCDRLVKVLGIYQCLDGGFTYYDFKAKTYRPSDSSMSFCTATVLVALFEAKQAGIEVPEKLIARAVRSIRRCRKKNGSYLYGPYLEMVPRAGINRPKGSSLRTQACNLALHLFDADVTVEDLVSGLGILVKHHRFAVAGVRRPIPHESWYQVSGYFYLYGYAYAGMLMPRIPKRVRARLRPILARHLLKCRQPDGSFWDYPLYGFHKAYGTGFALMTLADLTE